MKDFFKSEDFNFPETMSVDYLGDRAAALANEKLNALIESWPYVYCNRIDSADQNKWTASEIKHPIDTHKARLAFIEEIVKEPCKHEPYQQLSQISPVDKNWYCSKCGVELQATWSAVND